MRTSGPVHASRRDSPLTCQFCREELSESDVVARCPACDAASHQSCLAELGDARRSCRTLGCAGKLTVADEVAARRPSRARRVLAVGVLAAALGAGVYAVHVHSPMTPRPVTTEPVQARSLRRIDALVQTFMNVNESTARRTSALASACTLVRANGGDTTAFFMQVPRLLDALASVKSDPAQRPLVLGAIAALREFLPTSDVSDLVRPFLVDVPDDVALAALGVVEVRGGVGLAYAIAALATRPGEGTREEQTRREKVARACVRAAGSLSTAEERIVLEAAIESSPWSGVKLVAVHALGEQNCRRPAYELDADAAVRLLRSVEGDEALARAALFALQRHDRGSRDAWLVAAARAKGLACPDSLATRAGIAAVIELLGDELRTTRIRALDAFVRLTGRTDVGRTFKLLETKTAGVRILEREPLDGFTGTNDENAARLLAQQREKVKELRAWWAPFVHD